MASENVLAGSPRGEIAPNIGISDANREAVVQILARLLADEYILYTKTRKYHWNVTGQRFQQLHEFFKAQYTQLEITIDDVAERMPQLGGKAVATLEEFRQLARITEDAGQYPEANKMLSNLLVDHESVIRNLRTDSDACAEQYSDMGTNDFLIGLMEQHEKMAWMIRAHIEGSA
ncbi:MAG: DNA starvation/stationary phase protection protein [Nitrososphaera sp.]|nr:DNA starvation/stationary phase protection protein [Nitrososphaera sp.]